MNKIIFSLQTKRGEQLFLHIRLTGKVTEFITKDSFLLQVGQLVFPKGYYAKKHKHKINIRHIPYTAEVLFIKSGRLKYNIWDYDNPAKLIKEGIAEENEILILGKVAHSFESLSMTKIIEIKQGPFLGSKDKIFDN